MASARYSRRSLPTTRHNSASLIAAMRSRSSRNSSSIRSLLRHGGLFDGVNDLHVACTSAEIAGDGFLDLVARRLGVGVEQGAGGNQHAGRADAALRAAGFEEGLLKRVEAAIARQPFDGDDADVLQLADGDEAGVDDFAIDE